MVCQHRDIELRHEHSTKEVARRIGRNVHNLYKTMSRIHDMLMRCVRRTLAEETR